MSLSAKDIQAHMELLTYISDVLEIIAGDYDLIVYKSYRREEFAWKEAIEISVKRINVVKQDFEKISGIDERFTEHGLEGIELTLKSQLIARAYKNFVRVYREVREEFGRIKGALQSGRKKLAYFLKLADVYLESMQAVFPPLGGVKEIKELVENSLGVSQRT